MSKRQPYKNSPLYTREQHKKFEDWKGASLTHAPVELTNDEWCKFLTDNDGWERRGKTQGSYCIARIDYEKPYRLDNMIFIKVEDARRRFNRWKHGHGYS